MLRRLPSDSGIAVGSPVPIPSSGRGFLLMLAHSHLAELTMVYAVRAATLTFPLGHPREDGFHFCGVPIAARILGMLRRLLLVETAPVQEHKGA
jgi:hypothetical protein